MASQNGLDLCHTLVSNSTGRICRHHMHTQYTHGDTPHPEQALREPTKGCQKVIFLCFLLQNSLNRMGNKSVGNPQVLPMPFPSLKKPKPGLSGQAGPEKH